MISPQGLGNGLHFGEWKGISSCFLVLKCMQLDVFGGLKTVQLGVF